MPGCMQVWCSIRCDAREVKPRARQCAPPHLLLPTGSPIKGATSRAHCRWRCGRNPKARRLLPIEKRPSRSPPPRPQRHPRLKAGEKAFFSPCWRATAAAWGGGTTGRKALSVHLGALASPRPRQGLASAHGHGACSLRRGVGGRLDKFHSPRRPCCCQCQLGRREAGSSGCGRACRRCQSPVSQGC